MDFGAGDIRAHLKLVLKPPKYKTTLRRFVPGLAVLQSTSSFAGGFASEGAFDPSLSEDGCGCLQ